MKPAPVRQLQEKCREQRQPLYLAFVDLSLQRPYNRISNVAAFIRDEDGLMSSRMYPLSFLSPEAKAEIDELYRRSEQLAASLDIAGDHVGYMRLEIEPHEVEG